LELVGRRPAKENTRVRARPLTDPVFLTSTVEVPTLAAFSSSACAGKPEGVRFGGVDSKVVGASRLVVAGRVLRLTFTALGLSGSPECPGCRSSEDTGYADRDHRTPVD
jgi:hypothetical protein